MHLVTDTSEETGTDFKQEVDYPKDGIRTFGGGYLRYLEPGIDDPVITIDQVARGLAANVRFAGQGANPFTVAGHSAWVALAMLHDGRSQVEVLAGLLHDAAEAFVRDLPSPLKYAPGMDEYRVIENMVRYRINCALRGRFECADLEEAQRFVVPFYDKAGYEREAIDAFPDRPPVEHKHLDELASRTPIAHAFVTGQGVWAEFAGSTSAFIALYEALVNTTDEQFTKLQAYVKARNEVSGPLAVMV